MNNAIEKANKLAVESYDFKLGQYFSRGWEIFTAKPFLFIGYSVLSSIIMICASIIPFGNIVLSSPLIAGLYLVARKIDIGENVEFGDFFGGFKYIGQLILLSLVSSLIIGLGFICLIIPGIYLSIAYAFSQQLVLFGELEFWDAMESSRKVINRNWWQLLGFFFVSMLIAFGGILCFIVGVFIAYPWVACATYAAFADVFKLNEAHEDDILDHLVA